MSDKPHGSEDLVPQADQQASTETAERVGQEGEQAKVINQEQAKEQAKQHKEQ